MGNFVIPTQVGGYEYKMAAAEENADCKIAGSGIICNSNCNFSTFQGKALFNRMLFKLDLCVKNISL